MSSKNPKPPARNPNVVAVEACPGDDPAVLLAETVLRPDVRGASTLKAFSGRYGNLDLTALADALSRQAKAANAGDLTRAEALLMVQAQTLDAMFNALAQRALDADDMDTLSGFLRLALKAQSQSRATLETLTAVKQPTAVAFVKQANIAHGHQQVNNSTASGGSRARKSQNPPNELLEVEDGERLEPGATSAAGRTDQDVATVGAVNRAKDG